MLDPAAPKPNCTFNGVSFPCGTLQTLSGTGFGNNQRPNINPGTSCNSGVSGNQIFNPNAFTLIGYQIGTVGNAPRGACQGPHFVNGDLEFSKNWQFKERFRLRFSMDFFNAFNHPNFDATWIQGTGGNNGSGVLQQQRRCILRPGKCVRSVSDLAARPITSSARTATFDHQIGGANPGFGSTIQTKPAREVQYGLKLTF